MLCCRTLNNYRQGKEGPALGIEIIVQDWEVPCLPAPQIALDPGGSLGDCRGITGIQNRSEAREKTLLSHKLLNE